MKKFAGNKPLTLIRKQCKAAGIQFDNRLYRLTGTDYVVIRTKKNDSYSGEVLYNAVNGNFFGTTPEGKHFDSRDIVHEREPWFQMLLSFFYFEKEPKA